MTYLSLAEKIQSLKGATIENVSAKLNKEQTEFDCLTLFLSDGREVELWAYVSEFGSYVHAAESAMDIEIKS